MFARYHWHDSWKNNVHVHPREGRTLAAIMVKAYFKTVIVTNQYALRVKHEEDY